MELICNRTTPKLRKGFLCASPRKPQARPTAPLFHPIAFTRTTAKRREGKRASKRKNNTSKSRGILHTERPPRIIHPFTSFPRTAQNGYPNHAYTYSTVHRCPTADIPASESRVYRQVGRNYSWDARSAIDLLSFSSCRSRLPSRSVSPSEK